MRSSFGIGAPHNYFRGDTPDQMCVENLPKPQGNQIGLISVTTKSGISFTLTTNEASSLTDALSKCAREAEEAWSWGYD